MRVRLGPVDCGLIEFHREREREREEVGGTGKSKAGSEGGGRKVGTLEKKVTALQTQIRCVLWGSYFLGSLITTYLRLLQTWVTAFRYTKDPGQYSDVST